MSEKPISPLRQRMIEDMTVRNFIEKTRNDYIRHVLSLTAFLRRSPDTATPEDLRRFQLHQTQIGVRAPSINASVAGIRFFFTVTLDRPDMARHLTFVREPRKIPAVLSSDEVVHLLEAAEGDAWESGWDPDDWFTLLRGSIETLERLFPEDEDVRIASDEARDAITYQVRNIKDRIAEEEEEEKDGEHHAEGTADISTGKRSIFDDLVQ